MLFSTLDYAGRMESGIAIFKCFGFIMRCVQGKCPIRVEECGRLKLDSRQNAVLFTLLTIFLGTAGGVITVTAFAALVKLYPNHVATVTANHRAVFDNTAL